MRQQIDGKRRIPGGGEGPDSFHLETAEAAFRSV
jgi:hypothetical protein